MAEKLEDIRESIEIEAPIAQVWEALILPEKVSAWLGCMQFRPEIGSVFYMQPDPQKRGAGDISGATHCELLEIDENEGITFSWYLPGTPETRVSIDLEELDGGRTRVTLTHDGWDQFERDAVEAIWRQLKNGWKSFVLPQLKTVAEESAG